MAVRGTTSRVLGSVQRIRRYPVKGMGGEDLPVAFLDTTGVVGDRLYAFSEVGSQPRKFLGAHGGGELLLLRASIYDEPLRQSQYVSRPRVRVQLPTGTELFLETREMKEHLERVYDRRLELRFFKHGRSRASLSLVGEESIRELGEALEADRFNPLRFRSNICIRWDDNQPYYEDQLTGKALRIGGAVVQITRRTKRGPLVDINPLSGHPDKGVLHYLESVKKGTLGVYAQIVGPGTVRKGDSITFS